MAKFFSEDKIDSICKRFPNIYRTSKLGKTSSYTTKVATAPLEPVYKQTKNCGNKTH